MKPKWPKNIRGTDSDSERHYCASGTVTASGSSRGVTAWQAYPAVQWIPAPIGFLAIMPNQ